MLKNTCFIANFSPGPTGKLSLNPSQAPGPHHSNSAESKQTLGFKFFFLISPPTKHKCHGQGANSLQLGFYLPGPDASAKMWGQFQWPTSRAVCGVTNICKTHRAPLWQHLGPEAKVKFSANSPKSSRRFMVGGKKSGWQRRSWIFSLVVNWVLRHYGSDERINGLLMSSLSRFS